MYIYIYISIFIFICMILWPTVLRAIHLIADICCRDMQVSARILASQFPTERTLTSSKELFVTVALAAPSAHFDSVHNMAIFYQHIWLLASKSEAGSGYGNEPCKLDFWNKRVLVVGPTAPITILYMICLF